MMEQGISIIRKGSSHPNQRVRRFFSSFLIFSIFAFSGSVPASAAAPIGKITALHGYVTIKRPGSDEAHAVKQGDGISVGDDLRTGSDSAVQVTFADESFVNLSSKSAMRVNQYAFDAGENRRTARVRILSGRARFVLYKVRSGDSVFFVETNNALAVPAMLADFGVSAEAEGTEIAVLDQSVIVRNASSLVIGEVVLGPNQKTTVREKKPPSAPVVFGIGERKNYTKNMRHFRKGE